MNLHAPESTPHKPHKQWSSPVVTTVRLPEAKGSHHNSAYIDHVPNPYDSGYS